MIDCSVAALFFLSQFADDCWWGPERTTHSGSCWLKTEASDKTNKKTGRGESTRKQRHVGNPKFRPEALTDRWRRRRTGETDPDTRFCSQIILISLCLNRALCWSSRVVTAHLTDDFYILLPHTHKKKISPPPLDSSLWSSACLWTGLCGYYCTSTCVWLTVWSVQIRTLTGEQTAELHPPNWLSTLFSLSRPHAAVSFHRYINRRHAEY